MPFTKTKQGLLTTVLTPIRSSIYGYCHNMIQSAYSITILVFGAMGWPERRDQDRDRICCNLFHSGTHTTTNMFQFYFSKVEKTALVPARPRPFITNWRPLHFTPLHSTQLYSTITADKAKKKQNNFTLSRSNPRRCCLWHFISTTFRKRKEGHDSPPGTQVLENYI